MCIGKTNLDVKTASTQIVTCRPKIEHFIDAQTIGENHRRLELNDVVMQRECRNKVEKIYGKYRLRHGKPSPAKTVVPMDYIKTNMHRGFSKEMVLN